MAICWARPRIRGMICWLDAHLIMVEEQSRWPWSLSGFDQDPRLNQGRFQHGGGERGRIKKCAFLLYMSTISLHEKTPLRSLFGPPGAGRLSRPGRGPCERPSATIRHDTAIIRSGGKGPGDIVSTMSSSSRTATKSQRHLASAVCAVEGRCSSCWRHYPFLPLSECWHRA